MATKPSIELRVPPTTPTDLIHDFEVSAVPSAFPKLSTLKLPFVREIGVKESIRRLADIYGCKKFHVNLLQFWFLDFITDCLWKVQDEFQFPEDHQKIVLEWVGYVFNLVRAPHLNLSRKELFKIFNEALALAEQHVETGCLMIPLPEELFAVNAEIEEKKAKADGESSASSLVEPTTCDSYLAIDLEDGVRFFDLPPKVCPWDTDDDRLSSTIETVSENEIVIEKLETLEKLNAAEDEVLSPMTMDEVDNDADIMFEDFYKPDMRTPPRFVPSDDSFFSDSISISYESETEEIEEDEDEVELGSPTWIISKKKLPELPCPSKLFNLRQEETDKSEKRKEEEAVQAWYDYHLWQFRAKAMSDPNQGWYVASEDRLDPACKFSENKQIPCGSESESLIAKHNLMDYIKAAYDSMESFRKNRFINTCVIMAIKQIVYDYFHDTFQFSCVRLAYRYTHYLTTQELNTEWCIPKKVKGDLKRPKAKKLKIEKLPKEKEKPLAKPEPKKEKEEPPKKPEKAPEKPATEKIKIPEEDLEKVREEKRRIEELAKIAEENRTTVFPLFDAVDEKFFDRIFNISKASKKKLK